MSGHLTVHEDEALDRAILDLLRPVVMTIEQQMGRGLRSVALIGGFGRGEGGAYWSEGRAKIVNDFDLLIVPSGIGLGAWLLHASPLAVQMEHLARSLHVKQIDVGFRSVRMLRRPAKTVADYELATGHRLLHGAPLPVNLTVFDDGRAIPRSEGTVYFLNRGSGLLLARRYIGSDGSVAATDAPNFMLELDKGILAIGDAILIERRLYHASYRTRADRLARADLGNMPRGAWIRDHYLEAIERKLRPTPAMTSALPGDAGAQWHVVQSVMLEFFLDYESRRMGIRLEDWEAYASRLAKHWKLSARQRVIGAVRQAAGQRGRKRRPAIQGPREYLRVMPLLLSAVDGQSVREAPLGRAERMLGLEATPHRSATARWHAAVNCYLLAYHPGGAAGEVARRPLGVHADA